MRNCRPLMRGQSVAAPRHATFIRRRFLTSHVGLPIPKTFMKTFYLAVGLALGVLSLSARAQNQDTNNLNTALGRFESRPDVLIGQGFGDVGNLPLGQAEVRVRACECRNLATGEKLSGLSVAWGENGR